MVLKPGGGQSLNHVHNYQTSFILTFLRVKQLPQRVRDVNVFSISPSSYSHRKTRNYLRNYFFLYKRTLWETFGTTLKDFAV